MDARSRTSASASLGRASAFLVRHPPQPSAAPTKSTRAASQAQPLRPSPISPHAPSASPPVDASQLPLDLLEPAATRWASTAGRATRTAPRVRSTLGAQSDVVDTGVFVCPDTVVAALYGKQGGVHGDVVVTAECAGWLRVREQRTGAIRHQQQLRDGNEVSCLSWAAPPPAPQPLLSSSSRETERTRQEKALQQVIAVGQLSGLVSFYALVGESLLELPAATCVFHEAPILTCLPLLAPAASVAGSAVPLLSPSPSLPSSAIVAAPPHEHRLMTLDADGVAALWHLRIAEKSRRHLSNGGAGSAAAVASSALASLSVQLVDCSYACSPASSETGEDMAALPPVVISAAPLLHPASAACAVFTTCRFSYHPTSSAPEDGSSSGDEWDSADALVHLIEYTTEAHHGCGNGRRQEQPGLEATSLAMSSHLSDSVVSATTEEATAAPPPQSPHPPPVHRWMGLCTYALPDVLRTRRDAPAADTVTIASLCTVGCSGSANSLGQLWAGTTDGRILIWQAHTGVFVRCLYSNNSTASIHSLTCVPQTAGSDSAAVQALVWASQADGGVVAWSAATYAVVEVLPVSYPPPPPSGFLEGSRGGSNGTGVVTVRDAVDLLRATRHHPASGSPTSMLTQRKCGFTLFVQPMERVCMQRAWSVATDGTVRTWLLPAGDDAPATQVEGDVAAEAAEESDGYPRTPDEFTTLDAQTVQCFLQDKAAAYVREQQSYQMEWESMQSQLAALRDRNGVLAAALQQAIGQLERVSADGLVRSASPSTSPPVQPESSEEEEAGEERDIPEPKDADREEPRGRHPDIAATDKKPEDDDEGRPPSPPRNADMDSSSSSLSSAGSQVPGRLVVTSATPFLAPTDPGAFIAESPISSPAMQLHVQVLQQLLEELHRKLEESWSRNDALREELLMYQLRTLEREEDTARRIRESAMRESLVMATVADLAERDAPQLAMTATATPLESSSSPPTSTKKESEDERSDTAQRQQSPRDAAAATRSGGSRLSSPSRTLQVQAPPLEVLVSPPSPPLSPATAADGLNRFPDSPPSLRAPPVITRDSPQERFFDDVLSADHRSFSPVEQHGRITASAATRRFLSAASAALHPTRMRDAWVPDVEEEGEDGRYTDQTYRGATRPPSEPRHIRAPLPPVDNEADSDLYAAKTRGAEEAEEGDDAYGYDDDEEDDGPALVAAWSTSEGDISPISKPAYDDDTATATEEPSFLPQRIPPRLAETSSSLLAYANLPHGNASSAPSRVSHSNSSRAYIGPHVSSSRPVRVYTNTWTTPAKAAGRVESEPRPVLAPAAAVGVESPLPLRRAPPPRGTPVQRSDRLAVSSSPHAFRSPIIYRQS